MPYDLSPVEVRVLGVLFEKETTTPEYYPLTLNALINGCNQKSNRWPVTQYDEGMVRQALDSLRQRGWLLEVSEAGARTLKFRQRLSEVWNLRRQEQALLCELLLRGPQTPGELRSRAERMADFADLEEVDRYLRLLMEREPEPVVMRLARQAGAREARFAHLLAGVPEAGGRESGEEEGGGSAESVTAGKIAALEANVASLRHELEQLRTEWRAFRSAFGE